MNIESIYTLVGILLFAFVSILILKSKTPQVIKSRTQKRDEIVSEYKEKLKVALASCSDDKESRTAEKKSQLKKFSDELSRNIFFDEHDIKNIIIELAKE
ncbi:hypothetical protein [Sulfurimonas sp.]